MRIRDVIWHANQHRGGEHVKGHPVLRVYGRLASNLVIHQRHRVFEVSLDPLLDSVVSFGPRRWRWTGVLPNPAARHLCATQADEPAALPSFAESLCSRTGATAVRHHVNVGGATLAGSV